MTKHLKSNKNKSTNSDLLKKSIINRLRINGLTANNERFDFLFRILFIAIKSRLKYELNYEKAIDLIIFQSIHRLLILLIKSSKLKNKIKVNKKLSQIKKTFK